MNEEVAENLGLLLQNRSSDTRKAYLFFIERFLRFAGLKDSYDEFDIRKFCAQLEKEGKSRSYINSAFSAIKMLLRAKKQALLISSRDILPKVEETEQPAMATEDVRKLIEAVRSDGTSEQRFYLALSTIYGLRAGEMVIARREDIDINNRTILVHTEKGGRVRRHLIPDPVFAIITAFTIKTQRVGTRSPIEYCSASEINMMFKRICSLAGVRRKKRESWHSPRRRLITELITRGVKREEVANFMRWKNTAGITQHRSRNDPTAMVDKYYHPEDRAVDEEVFEKHPWIEDWR